MRLGVLGVIGAALLGACTNVPLELPDAAARSCAGTAAQPSRDPRIEAAVEEARRQHRLFGEQTIARDGSLVRVGRHEAEVPAWQWVARFWDAVGIGSLGVMTRDGRLPLADTESAAATPAGEALLRAAVVDTPWSAAFISHLIKSAGFGAAEFAFSDSHADYVRAALETSAAEAAGGESPQAYRACDAARTRPRAGDLLCATRGSTSAVIDFEALPGAMAARPAVFGFPMHCDLVVRADDAVIETIGGNVVNSVTLTRLAPDAGGVLHESYFTRAGPRRTCGVDGADCRDHLGRRPWVALLQFRR